MKPSSLGRIRYGALLLALLGWPNYLRAQALNVNYPDFSSVAGLGLQGDAVQAGTHVRLTASAPLQAGGVWLGTRRFVGAGFDTVFQFQISNQGSPGGEGFAFVLQNNALPALGSSGDGLGYDGIPNSLAVEFDLRPTPSRNDPEANHISVHTRQTLPNSADQSASLGFTTNGLASLADGNVHTARIGYAGGTFQVFVDDLANPLLTVALPLGDSGPEGSLNELLGSNDGQVWVGFTAATSDAVESHDLLNWSWATIPAPLTVALTSPLEGASYLCPARIILAADVASTGMVTVVEFFQGSTRLGEMNTNTGTYAWNNVVPGTYYLTAAATDETGRRSVSPPVKVTVYPASPPIGINFTTGADVADYPLSLIEEAGVVEQRLWNNLTTPTNGNGAAFNLKNGAGVITPVNVSWDVVGTAEESSVNPGLSSNHKLMKTYLADDGGTSGGQSNSVIIVQQVPFAVYDVLVYSDSANGQADCVVEFRTATNRVVFLRDAAGASFSGSFVAADGTSDQGSATPAGNYVRFNSFTNSSFRLTVTARSSSDGIRRAAVNAIQIVPSVNTVVPLHVTRGPYLQTGTPTSMIIRWRTSQFTDARVRYGTSPSSLVFTNEDPTMTDEHIVTLTNLQPNMRYYYAVGTTETNFAGGSDYYLTTSPTNALPTRIWFVSDYGFRNSGERAVRESYFNYASETKSADVWITGGDNDQTDGTDAHDQEAIFGTDYGYGALLRNHPVWPTPGNHDYQAAQGQAYYANFSLPANGEAGGVPSGSEHFYSFNRGDIHFVSLDSIDASLSSSTNSAMLQWLQEDLASTTQRWIIAYWHGTPYTKGSHDSDNDSDTLARMTQMRENALPILESYGVDLVLCGHSHVYERSWMLHGHYGHSESFSETNKIDGGDGKADGTGPYLKSAGAGTVYVTAAVGGQPQGNTGVVHPAHLVKISGTLGSLVIDVNGSRLDFQFIDTNGVALDYFTISKEPAADLPATPAGLTSGNAGPNQIQLTWNNTPDNERGFILERSIDGQNFVPIATLGANLTNYTDASLPAAATWFYRIRAWNDAGNSDYSNIATVAGAAPLSITRLQLSDDSVTLTWQSTPGKSYEIQQTDNLSNPDWRPLGVVVVATADTTSWTVPRTVGMPAGFFRIHVTGN